MDNISKFLERFKNFVPREIFLKDVVVKSISEVAGVNIEKKNIKISGNNIFLNVSPNIKNLVFIKKQKILENIATKINYKIDLK